MAYGREVKKYCIDCCRPGSWLVHGYFLPLDLPDQDGLMILSLCPSDLPSTYNGVLLGDSTTCRYIPLCYKGKYMYRYRYRYRYGYKYKVTNLIQPSSSLDPCG